ncbi:uncharacterized protein LOC111487964 isoform X7 [Cucurbita maxima]|uniref:Uncharacterized protein LOC111487964 isoform X7 n=1 Tax=Cucurbita maxima TaxID=3661 RepID=A0A6J1JVQ1_CUCMA|nr:uncharacterized protein LOC111487964 isoform X7 [Cucurbita maxima]
METSSTASFHVLPSPSNPPFASERPALYGACVWTLYSFDSSLQFLFFISFFFSLTGLSGVDHAVFVAKSVGIYGFQCAKWIDLRVRSEELQLLLGLEEVGRRLL